MRSVSWFTRSVIHPLFFSTFQSGDYMTQSVNKMDGRLQYSSAQAFVFLMQ